MRTRSIHESETASKPKDPTKRSYWTLITVRILKTSQLSNFLFVMQIKESVTEIFHLEMTELWNDQVKVQEETVLREFSLNLAWSLKSETDDRKTSKTSSMTFLFSNPRLLCGSNAESSRASCFRTVLPTDLFHLWIIAIIKASRRILHIVPRWWGKSRTPNKVKETTRSRREL